MAKKTTPRKLKPVAVRDGWRAAKLMFRRKGNLVLVGEAGWPIHFATAKGAAHVVRELREELVSRHVNAVRTNNQPHGTWSPARKAAQKRKTKAGQEIIRSLRGGLRDIRAGKKLKTTLVKKAVKP